MATDRYEIDELSSAMHAALSTQRGVSVTTNFPLQQRCKRKINAIENSLEHFRIYSG